MIKRGMWGKMEARAYLAADKLTTSTGYNRKVEVSTSFFGLPLPGLLRREKSGDQKQARRWFYRDNA